MCYRPVLLLTPTVCDFCATSLQFFGLLFVSPSVYQMLRGGTVVLTCLLSVWLLKKEVYRHHYFGIIFVIAGITTVGMSAVLYASS